MEHCGCGQRHGRVQRVLAYRGGVHIAAGVAVVVARDVQKGKGTIRAVRVVAQRRRHPAEDEAQPPAPQHAKRAAIDTGKTTLLNAVTDDSDPDDVLAEILGPAYKHEECDSMASEPESETVGDSFRADTMNSALVGSEYPLPQSHAHAQLDSGATLTITPDGDLVRNTTPVYTTIKMADDHSLTGWFEKGIFSGLTHGIPWPDHPALVVPTFPHTLLSQPAAVTAGNAFIHTPTLGAFTQPDKPGTCPICTPHPQRIHRTRQEVHVS